MTVDTKEIKFEEHIEEVLTSSVSGYRKREPGDFNRQTCFDEALLFEFLAASQPQEWQKLKDHYGEDAKKHFLARLDKEIGERGILDVLRQGVADTGARFQLLYFPPESRLNPEHARQYEKNIFSIIRQLKYSLKNENAIDTVLFVNGTPLITIELKNQLTGQNIWHAIKQYQRDRDSREPLLKFKRCLVHFAVDNDLVHMTTRLKDKATYFLPFNKGCEGGAGNPVNPGGFKSSYLWEEILQKDSLLLIIRDFMMVIEDRRSHAGESAAGEAY